MGDEVTNITTPGVLAIGILVLLSVLIGRRWVPIPVLIAGSWLTLGQRLVFLDLNFTALRVVLIAIMIRMIVRGEWNQITPSAVDRLFKIWNVLRVVTFTALWLTVDAFVNRTGFALDAIALYYCFRYSMRDMADVARITRVMAYILVPVAVLMTAERVTGFNQFSALGGVPAFSIVRDEIVRSQGPYSHPILAGTVGAIWLPLFLGLWRFRGGRMACIAGVLSGLGMVITSGSSGPLMTVLCAVGALCLWPLRKQMGLVRKGIVAVLVVLQLSMSEPIWFIFARINVLSASTGWHRSFLIDMAVKHFFEWFALGTKDVGAWGVFAGDITNHYLIEGLRGGFATLVVFVLILKRLYSLIGYAVRWENCLPRGERFFVWTLGAMIAGHTATFFSVAYFESQSMLHWFVTAAMVVAVGHAVDQARSDSAIEEGLLDAPSNLGSETEVKVQEVAL